MGTFRSENYVKIKNENTLRKAMEMLSTTYQGSAPPDDMLRLKEGVVGFCNPVPKRELVPGI